jgi:hypothetical protein
VIEASALRESSLAEWSAASSRWSWRRDSAVIGARARSAAPAGAVGLRSCAWAPPAASTRRRLAWSSAALRRVSASAPA